MKPLDFLPKFWEWITLCRSASVLREHLALQEQRSRAEIHALTMQHDQEVSILKSERDKFKAQVARVEADHALTKEVLKKAQGEIQQLQGDLSACNQHLNLYRGESLTYDDNIRRLNAEIARLKARGPDRPGL